VRIKTDKSKDQHKTTIGYQKRLRLKLRSTKKSSEDPGRITLRIKVV
jgi:hypothetical protein